MAERESAELIAIDEALKRVADGSFGLCVDCGVGIPAARLHANPTALRCMDCQGTLERASGNAMPAGY
jgi:DnaK suppressor protein